MSLTACTKIVSPLSVVRQRAIQVEASQQKGMGWYAVRVKIHWEEDQQPNWYLGTLIAGEVIDPLLRQHPQAVIYWRLHRRAVRDRSGHTFSFIFYGSHANAVKIYQAVEENGILASLLEQKYLDKVSYDPLQTQLATQVAETSDPDWPDEMRNSWPYFMMGASQMWLDQVRSFKQEISGETEQVRAYKQIQKRITKLWQEQAEHALMHHLNGLYAYQPVLVRF